MSNPLPFPSALQWFLHRAVLAGLMALSAPVALGQVIYTYDDTPASAIATGDNNCPAGGITRTFSVPDSFNVGAAGTIALGIVVGHANRDNLQIRLIAPNGNSVTLADGSGTDANDNYNVTFGDPHDTTAPLNDGDNDPLTVASGTVHFRRLVNITNLTSTLFPSASSVNGTWTLRICDDTNGSGQGSYLRSRLTLRNNAVTSVQSACAINTTFDWGTVTTSPASVIGAVLPDGTTITTGGVVITQAQTVNAPVDAQASFRRLDTTNGGDPGYYAMIMDLRTPGTTDDAEDAVESTRFTFNPPVAGLDFQLLDVDFSSGNWEDYVQVIGFDQNGMVVPYLETFVAAGATLSRVGDWTESDGTNVDNASNAGNIRYRFLRPVNSITVGYAAGDEPANDPAQQVVGIGDPLFCAFDFGDAPLSYCNGVAGNCPRHGLQNRDTLFIGSVSPDGESAPAFSAGANGDDTNLPTNDENGIFFPPPRIANAGWVCGAYTTNPALNQYCVTINATNTTGSPAQLVAWIDFNNDGDFNDPGERSLPDPSSTSTTGFATGNVPSGSIASNFVLVFSLPAPIPNNITPSMARVRITTDSVFFSDSTPPSHLGSVTDGEIQDHAIPINTLPVTLAGFNAVRLSASQLSVRWTVATEAGTLGYRLYQADGKGELRPLGTELTLARGVDSLVPQSYELTVASSADGALYLEELSNGGRTERFGPFALGSAHGDSLQFQAVPWSSLRASQASATRNVDSARLDAQRGAGRMAAEVLVSSSGVQEIRVSDLQGIGLDLTGRQASQLRLSNGTRTLPLQVEPAGALTASSVIRFVGQAVEDSLYTRTRPYLLEVLSATDSLAWRTVSAAPTAGLAADQIRTRFVLDEDRHYSFSAPGADPWYYDTVQRNGASTARSFTLPVRGLREGPASLALTLWGGIDYPGSDPDHRYTVSVNGVELGERLFDGVSDSSAQWVLPPGTLREGDNEVRITLLDTGYPVDILRIESIEVQATATLDAVDGRLGVAPTALNPLFDTVLSGSFEDSEPAPLCGSACAQLELRGYASTDLLALRVSGEAVEHLVGYTTRVEADGVVIRLRPPALLPQQDGVGDDARIVVVERTQVRRPALRPAPDHTHPLQGGPAELLVIAPEAYVDALQPLLNARRNEGLSARTVTVAQIYQHYSQGVIDPQAIRTYLQAARAQLGTRYVLLAGGDTYDYFNRLALGSVSDIPTFYGRTHAVVNHAPLDSRYADLNDDGLPELAVGRLPVRSATELSALVERILRPAPAGAAPQPVFAAERANPAEGSDYRAELDGLIQTLSVPWQQGTRVYLDEYPTGNGGVAQARNDLFAAIRNGAGLVSYLGHGSPTVWSREQLLQSGQLFGAMTATGERGPVITEFGCWGGYFVAPQYQSLVHGWLQAGPAGTPAVFASSGLTEHHSDVRMAATLLPALTQSGVRLGDALLQAKQALQAEPEVSDVLRGMTLFGDPSMRMPN